MHDDTLLTHLGRHPQRHDGTVNAPVSRASTILFPTLAAFDAPKAKDAITYGRYGTTTTKALEQAVGGMENAAGAIVVGSGKAAIVLTLLALVRPGDHVLIVDTAYAPTRQFADRVLTPWGVDVEYYDPLLGAGIEGLLRPATRLVFTESPGSLTFEVQDIPAIVAVARAAGVLVVTDNTWASPLFFKPISLGADISIHAATKYIGGHSDIMMGIVACAESVHDRVRAGINEFGAASSPDDCFLALRGIRTLSARLERHERSSLLVAEWLASHPMVRRVMYPALPEDPGHALWQRDFTGATGLFGFVIEPCSRTALAAMLDHLELYGMGFSWGGYESLLIPTDPRNLRTATRLSVDGQYMRIHVGLEDPADLIADLAAGFDRLKAAA